jgi:NADH dehydrogenase
MSILLAGATGFVGNEIGRRLRRAGHRVTALLRHGPEHAKARELSDAGIGIVEGDLTDAQSLRKAVTGSETVISTVSSMPTGANDGLRHVDLEGTLALIEEAERAGVKRFVYISYSGNIREESPLETAKRSCENRLLEGRMDAVILRPSYFMEMWLSPALGFDPTGRTARIYGTGEVKVSYISAMNVAEFAVASATRPYAQRKTILELGGPEGISQLAAVRIFEQQLNLQIKVEHLPRAALQAQHQSSDPLQKTFAALLLAYAKGDEVTGAVATAALHGVTLKSVEEYAAEVRGGGLGRAV